MIVEIVSQCVEQGSGMRASVCFGVLVWSSFFVPHPSSFHPRFPVRNPDLGIHIWEYNQQLGVSYSKIFQRIMARRPVS